MSDVRINAIRNLYNGVEGDCIKLDSGEVIYCWVLLDENGAVTDHLELDDIELLEAYEANTIWMEEHEYEKIG